MFTKAFWLGTLDRAVKSAAQALVLMFGAGPAVLNILSIDAVTSFGVAGGAVVLSVLTSLISAPFGDKGSTSLLPGAS